MTWRALHISHYFADLSDGSSYGPKDSQAIDMMHKVAYIDFLTDKEHAVAHLLPRAGAQALYTYDLGDSWWGLADSARLVIKLILKLGFLFLGLNGIL